MSFEKMTDEKLMQMLEELDHWETPIIHIRACQAEIDRLTKDRDELLKRHQEDVQFNAQLHQDRLKLKTDGGKP